MDPVVAHVATAVIDAFRVDSELRLHAFVSALTSAGTASQVLHRFLPPFLVAVGGPPGSGKTVFAGALAHAISVAAATSVPSSPIVVSAASAPSSNTTTERPTSSNRDSNEGETVARCFASASVTLDNRPVRVVPMDGYHHTRATLRAMPNPERAFRLRGAPFTFDAARYRDDIRALRSSGKLIAPSFDHAVGDPVEGAIAVDATTTTLIPTSASDSFAARRSIVVVEGLYALYTGEDEWADATRQFDLLVSLKLDAALCTERLVQRHMAAWGISREEALIRASGSDAANGVLVANAAADLRVRSTPSTVGSDAGGPIYAGCVVVPATFGVVGEEESRTGISATAISTTTTTTTTTATTGCIAANCNVMAKSLTAPICTTFIEATVQNDAAWVCRAALAVHAP